MHPDLEAAQRLGDQIAELSAHIEVTMARVLDLIGEFDALGGWGMLAPSPALSGSPGVSG